MAIGKLGTPYLLGYASQSAATQLTITPIVASGSGDILVVFTDTDYFAAGGGKLVYPGSCSDSAGNQYTLAAAQYSSSFIQNPGMVAWAAYNTRQLASGSSITVTWTPSTITTDLNAVVIGLPGAVFPDQKRSGYTLAAALTFTTGQLELPSEVAVAYWAARQAQGAPQITADWSSLAEFQGAGNTHYVIAAAKLVTTQNPVTAAATTPARGLGFTGILLTFTPPISPYMTLASGGSLAGYPALPAAGTMTMDAGGSWLGPAEMQPQPPPAPPVFAAGSVPQPADFGTLVQGPLRYCAEQIVFRAEQAGTQSLPAAAWAPLAYDTVLEDPWGGWSTASSPVQPAYSWLPPYTGWYRVTFQFSTAAAAAAWAEAGVGVSGVNPTYEAAAAGTAAAGGGAGASVIVPMIGGTDYIQFLAWTSAALTTDTSTPGRRPWVEITAVQTDLAQPAVQGVTLAGYLPLSGGTLLGPLFLAADPTTGLGAATKQYVDSQIPAHLPPNGAAGGDLTGTYPNPGVARINGLAVSVSPGGTTTYLRADGSWSAPAGGGGGGGGLPVTTPESHGAAGNGTTDDTTAIRNAITAAGTGGYIWFANTYLVSGALSPLARQTWLGPGLVKIAGGNTNSIISASSISGFTLGPGLTFDGQRASQTASNNSGLLRFTSCTNVLITGITVQNTYGGASFVGTCGITFELPQKCRIEGTNIYNCGYGIIMGATATDTTAMYGNTIADCVVDTTDWDGIFLTENAASTTPATVHGYLHGTTVENCRITGAGDMAIEIGSGNVGATVTGCTIDNTANTAVGNGGILVRDATGVAITGNTIRGLLKSAAVGITTWNLNGTIDDVAITGNTIENVDYGIWDQSGITGLVIAGNCLNQFSQTSNGSDGIKLISTNGFTIAGNTITNGRGGTGFTSCEAVNLRGVTNGTVTGNMFAGNAGADALIINATSSYVTVTGNKFVSNSNAMRVFDSASTYITVMGNDFQNNTNGFGFPSGAGTGCVAKNNAGYNPVGAVTVGVPASGSPTGTAPYDRDFYVTNGSSSCAYAIFGGPTVTVPASAAGHIHVPAGKTLTPTYSSTPSWVVEAL